MKIKQFIHDKCRRSFGKFDQWKNLTAGSNNFKQAIEYLMECLMMNFLEQQDRHIFSYKNGVFITKVPKENGDKKWTGIHMAQKVNLFKKTVASKYFDYDFNDFPDIEEDSWFDIMKHCPNLKRILDYQEFLKSSKNGFVFLWENVVRYW